MPGQVPRIDGDAHRYPLGELDPVAAGILRRQNREDGAGAPSQSHHPAVVGDGVTIKIGMQRHRRAGAHSGQTGFLDVGSDPHLLQWHHGEQALARVHPLSGLHRLLRDDAGDRGADDASCPVQAGQGQGLRRRTHGGVSRRAGGSEPRAEGCAMRRFGADFGLQAPHRVDRRDGGHILARTGAGRRP